VPTPVHQPTLELEAPLPSPPADLRPMLARTGHRLPASGEARLVDPTWGGLRVLAAVRGRSVRLLRDGRDIAADFPEIVTSLASLDLSDAVLDGEIVGQGAARTALAAHRRPPAAGPATLVISDLPWFGGRARIADHLVQRRERLAGLAIAGRHLVVVEAASGAQAVLQVVALHGLTGIVVKRADSPYLPGLRSRLWTLVRVADLRAADGAAALDEPGTVDGDGLAAARGGSLRPDIALLRRLPLGEDG
jgi:bifunctional non-homologous end joining protein LigD